MSFDKSYVNATIFDEDYAIFLLVFLPIRYGKTSFTSVRCFLFRIFEIQNLDKLEPIKIDNIYVTSFVSQLVESWKTQKKT